MHGRTTAHMAALRTDINREKREACEDLYRQLTRATKRGKKERKRKKEEEEEEEEGAPN